MIEVVLAKSTEEFPGDFYVAVATVVPVLFVALAVEGTSYSSLVKTYGDLMKTAGDTDRNVGLRFLASVAGLIAQVAAFAIILLAGISELVALNALLHQRADAQTAVLVSYGVGFLLSAVLAGPMIAIMRVTFTALREQYTGLFRELSDAIRIALTGSQRSARDHDEDAPDAEGLPDTTK
ncbi:hypothetical protein [Mycobacterium sp. 852013-50091_SCH5140682]|uniref:hypothetical protein n=1 Tax=Mycobacterium sp. 852013-50091_SCH5140682 TaxID=1834109 RepID=UPI0012EA77BD|nr:hypothetical protein [Mycobacterium sp. 852013-50091_SCH5140682]